ncbi:Vegetative incompatibility protein HET-E-1 [Rhizoctonia solani AG-1 IB]|uniref:Vegetative incompatibility protein HET-E-1 n=1 Tax=Thanatephorus cucumeris (strain AG1-IB / isolate 7/3/14) TaxID=1108050 RepID=M5C914_THACB|nr:Vegetative incompatibility protein HET-E-1 [Rhizoctonia solani AG-1 IB]
MSFVTSLQESLAQSKHKWKKRLRIGSETTGCPPPVLDLRPGPASLTQSNQVASSASNPIHDSTTIVNPDPKVAPKSPPRETSSTWAAVSALLDILEAGGEAFPPAKPVVSGLKLCVNALLGTCHQHKEYEYLAAKLKEILCDLNEHMKESISLKMTNSVKRIYNDIEQEFEMVTKKQEKTIGRRLMESREESNAILDCYRRIADHFQRLTLNCTMNTLKVINEHAVGMSPSMSAVFNSAEAVEVQRRGCTEGTRKAQIDLLLEWASTPDAGKTCWMNGMAGTGKTTIAYTVCAELEKVSRLGASFFCSRLGASFFCSRNIQECRQVKHITPSIAYQLARFSLPFRCALDMVLEEDSDGHTRALNVQYQKLILEPLVRVQKSLPLDLIVVIDALDECENEDTVGQILSLLLSTTVDLPIRFLMSSRPEAEITRKMTGRLDGQDDARLVLHNLDSSDVRKDIEAYMRSELEGILLNTAQLRGLLESCGLLFIFASTACRFIRRGHETETLEEAVSTICSSVSIPAQRGNPIDILYLTVLKAAFERSNMSKDNLKRTKDILEMVICAIEPMTPDAIAGLLNLKSGKQVSALIQPLRSVLNVPKATGVVITLHASFPDFMLSTERSSEFCCAQETRHTLMAKACLQMVEAIEPRFNICTLPSSYLLDNDVEHLDKRASELISPGLMYACRYWTAHLRLGEAGSKLMESVRDFFSLWLLLWMEVMNLGKYMRYGTRIVQDAEKWCAEHKAPEDLIALVNDAFQFVSVFASNSVSKSTPHIYVSMLPFWPRSRPISTTYMPRTSGLVQPTGTAINRRQLALIATWKVSTRNVESMSLTADGGRLVVPSENSIEVYDTTTGESVLSLTDERAESVDYVAVSPDGTTAVFSREDDTAYLWDMKNGGTVTQLLPDNISGIISIAFSCDGSCIACGLKNGDVYICRMQQETGCIVRLTGHNDWVRSVVFSPSGLHLAAGSGDKTVRVWNVQTGQPVGEPFEGHTDWVMSVLYSDDGSRLASSSRDNTIRVWDPQTGQTMVGPLKGHSHNVSSVSFSPGGAFIASGSRDHTIRVYDAHTGHTVLGPLHGHTNWVNWVKYSPDGTRLYSCSDDGTVRTWNVQDRSTSDTLSRVSGVSTAIYSVRYSHSGQHIVSGSKDGTVHVWDVRTGELVRGPLRGHQKEVASVDYSPNDQHIASASWDRTLRLWDATTGNDIHGPMRGHRNFVNCVRFSADGSALVSGSVDGTVRMWDMRTGQQTRHLLEDDSGILSVGMSSDGRRVVCGSIDGRIRVVDGHTGDTLVGPIQAHTNWVRSVEMWADGMRFVSGSDDKSVRIWNAPTGKQVAVCGDDDWSHSGDVFSVCVSLNGLYVASGSSDGTACVWNKQNGKRILGPLRGHTRAVLGVQFSPDGSHVVSCSYDGTIRFWDVSSIGGGVQEQGVTRAATAEESKKNSKGSVALDQCSLDQDGWMVDSHGRRLLWVPSDLRQYLSFPPTSSALGEGLHFLLETGGWKVGDEWIDCYRM